MSKSRNERWAMDTSDLIDECEELETANERLQAQVAELIYERDNIGKVAQEAIQLLHGQVAELTEERDSLREAGQTIKGYYRDNWAWSGQATDREIAAACALLEEEKSGAR